MADIYAYGIHDYCNYEHNGNFDYPQNWIDESEKIDDWITDNEEYIYKFKRNLILSYKNDILNMAEK